MTHHTSAISLKAQSPIAVAIQSVVEEPVLSGGEGNLRLFFLYTSTDPDILGNNATIHRNPVNSENLKTSSPKPKQAIQKQSLRPTKIIPQKR